MEAILLNLGLEVAGQPLAAPSSSSPLPGTRVPGCSPGVGGTALGGGILAPGATSSASVTARATTGEAVPQRHGDGSCSPASPQIARPNDLSQAAAGLDRLLLDAVQDEEELEEDTRRRRLHALAAEQQAAQHRAALPPAALTRSKRMRVAGTAAGPPCAVPPGAIEPAFEFAPVPSDAALASNKDKFVSLFMLQVVANWPQTVATAKRRRLNNDNDDCPGAAPGAHLGTNATLKTWATRIRVACSFADFVGRAVCWHPRDPCPSDVERDRGVRKFFRCLTPFTKRVIVAFLNCRKKGLPVAGGGKRLSAVSLKDFTNALTFMFGEGKVDGPNGDDDLVLDCPDRAASWRAKGEAELTAERLVREDPGTFVGNPMTTTDLKNWRSATHKQARLDGEQSKSAAAVTPELMRSLHNELWLKHSSSTEPAPTVNQSKSAPSRRPVEQPFVYSAPSDADADQLTYTFYALAFISLARPTTLVDIKFEDVTYPDMKLAENAEFFNRYV